MQCNSKWPSCVCDVVLWDLEPSQVYVHNVLVCQNGQVKGYRFVCSVHISLNDIASSHFPSRSWISIQL